MSHSFNSDHPRNNFLTIHMDSQENVLRATDEFYASEFKQWGTLSDGNEGDRIAYLRVDDANPLLTYDQIVEEAVAFTKHVGLFNIIVTWVPYENAWEDAFTVTVTEGIVAKKSSLNFF